MRPEEKVRCQTPTPGKKPVRIPAWKYEAVRKAILDVVPRKEPGIEFQELPKRVARKLPVATRRDLGSVSWHTTVVKLHMEVVGELRRVPGISPQRLVR
jgi:hypothetical protein